MSWKRIKQSYLEDLTMNKLMQPGRITCSLLILLMGLSPTTAFGQAAGQPVAQGDTVNANLLCGNWQGSWVSCKSGHNGRLRATFCRISKTKVQAKFTGSFCKVFPFRYKAVLDIVHEEDGLIQLRGSRKLGPLMGTFYYEAAITENQFKASYRSKRDCGQWNMTRVACGCN